MCLRRFDRDLDRHACIRPVGERPKVAVAVEVVPDIISDTLLKGKGHVRLRAGDKVLPRFVLLPIVGIEGHPELGIYRVLIVVRLGIGNSMTATVVNANSLQTNLRFFIFVPPRCSNVRK